MAAEADSNGLLLSLTRFESPLPVSWLAQQVDRMTPSERARLARIRRPLRREQFVVGHTLLRRLLIEVRRDDVVIDVEADGRPRLTCSAAGTPIHVSIAHSADVVAVIVAGGPVGVDLESMQSVRDPRAAAALLGLPAAESNDPDSVLRAWVAAEAQLKAGQPEHCKVWLSTWNRCHLAVAGTSAPLTGVLQLMTGTYNAAELEWGAFHGSGPVRA